MIMYSGWTVIREAYSESGEDERLLGEIVKRIKGIIEELRTQNGFYDFRPMSGSYHHAYAF
jgi:hypothetical protein